jgi:hypothetical protein
MDRVVEELELGQPDAVLARNHAAEFGRQRHDAHDGRVGGLQHGVVVGIDRDVGVHVAVAGVHVQRHEHAALQHVLRGCGRRPRAPGSYSRPMNS